MILHLLMMFCNKYRCHFK